MANQLFLVPAPSDDSQRTIRDDGAEEAEVSEELLQVLVRVVPQAAVLVVYVEDAVPHLVGVVGRRRELYVPRVVRGRSVHRVLCVQRTGSQPGVTYIHTHLTTKPFAVPTVLTCAPLGLASHTFVVFFWGGGAYRPPVVSKHQWPDFQI